jgi:hypothetical protein
MGPGGMTLCPVLLPRPQSQPLAWGFISKQEPQKLFITVTALSRNNVAFQIVFRLGW